MAQKMSLLHRRMSHVWTGMAPQIVKNVVASSGQPLDRLTRSNMEARFSHDFSRVRVHSDALASESAAAISAKAYTTGNHIVIGREVTGAEHDNVLAHELTHVIERRGTDRSPRSQQASPDIGEALLLQ